LLEANKKSLKKYLVTMEKVPIIYQIIAQIIESKSRVLDIGCGQGELLSFLINNNNIVGKGIEIDENLVSEAVAKGINIVQGDADIELEYYPSNKYDYIVINNSLQVMKNPQLLLKELLRIAPKVIVNIPNFAYWKSRCYLFFKGEMPVTNSLSYQWYETPNIHFCTMKDFIRLVENLGYNIIQRHYIVDAKDNNSFLVSAVPNLFAEFVLFTLERGEDIVVKENLPYKNLRNSKEEDVILAKK